MLPLIGSLLGGVLPKLGSLLGGAGGGAGGLLSKLGGAADLCGDNPAFKMLKGCFKHGPDVASALGGLGGLGGCGGGGGGGGGIGGLLSSMGGLLGNVAGLLKPPCGGFGGGCMPGMQMPMPMPMDAQTMGMPGGFPGMPQMPGMPMTMGMPGGIPGMPQMPGMQMPGMPMPMPMPGMQMPGMQCGGGGILGKIQQLLQMGKQLAGGCMPGLGGGGGLCMPQGGIHQSGYGASFADQRQLTQTINVFNMGRPF